MGTRHLICVINGGDYRIAQYGQWDGYPEGQGAAILKFLKSPMAERLKKNLGNCTWITNDEYEKLWEEFGVDAKQEWIDHDVYQDFCNKHPELSRDAGAKILEIVAGATGKIKLQNSLNFSRDSLFCEWAYVIDFDKTHLRCIRALMKHRLMSLNGSIPQDKKKMKTVCTLSSFLNHLICQHCLPRKNF